MASGIVVLSLLVVAQGLEIAKNWTRVEDVIDELPKPAKLNIKGGESEVGQTEKALAEAKARTAFLKKELQDILAAKAKHKKENVMQKKPETAPQKFRLFKMKEGAWKTQCAVRGLALGGWFVPEKFINVHNFPTPDMPKGMGFKEVMDTHGTIYEGSKAPDMCRLSEEIGRQELDARFKHHLNTFITEKDFEFIAKTGVNTLRIPIGYWNVIEDPYKIYAPINPANSLALMDKALDWAKKYDLAVILDVHSSPGSQNGWEHSGCSLHGSGLFEGPDAKKNQQLSVEVSETLAKRFGQHPALLGIQVINEPTRYQGAQLMDLYRDSYDAIRKHTKDVWVIVYAHKYEKVKNLARDGDKFHNLILDKHEYACFGDGRTGPPGATYNHHRDITKRWVKEVKEMNSEYPTILGEWSLCHGGGSALKLKDWNLMQQATWASSTVGSVFWTYKTLTDNARWSYRVALDDVDVWGELPTCSYEDDHKKKKWLPALAAKEHEEELEAETVTDDKVDAGYEWEASLPAEVVDEEGWTEEGSLAKFMVSLDGDSEERDVV